MNIFEGSRRVAKLVAAGIIAGFLFYGITESIGPVTVSYLWSEDGKIATRINQCAVTDTERTATQAKLAEFLKDKKITDFAIGKITTRSIFRERFESKTDSGKDVLLEHCADISAIFLDQSYTSANSATKFAIEKKYGIKGRCWAFSIKHNEANERDCSRPAIQNKVVEARAAGYDDTAIAQYLSSMSSEALTKLYGETFHGVKVPPGFRLELKPGDEIMGAFNPDEYLAAKAKSFDPDAYFRAAPVANKGIPATRGTALGELSSAEDYATWIVKNANKKGTPDFDKVAKAYEEAKIAESSAARTTAHERLERQVFLEAFKIPKSDEIYIKFLVFIQFIKNFGQHILAMIVSLAGLWFLTWAVGWIVRGFMGIPRGLDRRA